MKTIFLCVFLATMLTFTMSGYGSNQITTGAKKAATVATKQAKNAQKVASSATKRAAKKVAEARRAAVNVAEKPNSKKAKKRASIAIEVAKVTLEQAKNAQKVAEQAAEQARLAREAVAEFKRTESRARWEAQQQRWKRNLNLSCPAGGWENVVIEPELGRDSFRVSGNRVARFLLARYMGLVTAFNPYPDVVNIDEGSRALVRDMCPKGKISLVATLGWDAGILGGDDYEEEEFLWTVSLYKNGHLYKGKSPRLLLYVYQWVKEKKPAPWTMEVDDIDRPLPKHLPEHREGGQWR